MSPRAPSAVRRTDLVAGLGDAGFASLGTFLAGIIAVRELPTHSLALYVVLSSATIFSMPLPRQLTYMPAQIGANLETLEISPVIRRSVRNAGRASALAFAIVVVTGLTLLHAVALPELAALTLTAGAFAVVSPLQDHVRGSLHVVGRHFSAAVCSVVLAAVIAGLLTATLLLRLPPVAIALAPFGALVAGNTASLIAGLALLRGVPRHVAYDRGPFAVRSRYLLMEVVVQGSWLGCNYIVLFALGAKALAQLETARLSASPILILAAGASTFMVSAVLRQLSTAKRGEGRAGRLLIRAFLVIGIGGALYAITLTAAAPFISTVLNRHVDLPLALTRVAAFAIEGCSGFMAVVLLATGASKAAVLLSSGAGVVGLVGTAALSPLLGPVALPLSQGSGMAVRLLTAIGLSRDQFRSSGPVVERVAATAAAD